MKQWNSKFFAFSLIIEGTTEKVLQFVMPIKSIYNQNLGFIEQKMYFWTQQRGLNKNIFIDIIFDMKIFSCVLFWAAPYRLMLVLNKDVLFHLLYLLKLYVICLWSQKGCRLINVLVFELQSIRIMEENQL